MSPSLTPDPSPPFGDDTDEAASAYLDGELEGFARDHGLEVGDVRARLEAWPGLGERLGSLSAARDLRAADAPLDEATRRHLAHTAAGARSGDQLTPARARRTPVRRWQLLAGAAAAVIALVIVVVVLASGGDDTKSATNERAGAAASASRAPYEVLGDITDPEVLRTRLGSTTAPSKTGGTSSSDAADASSARRAAAAAAIGTEAQARACGRTIATRDAPGEIQFLAGASYQGRPVVVVAIRDNRRTAAFVADATTCAIVTFQSR